MVSITKDQVQKCHHAIAQAQGKAFANLSMRLLRALFNFAAARYEDVEGHALIVENPVKRLSQTRAWYRVERRQTLIKVQDLPTWYKAVMNLKNDTVRDYLLVLLFTGLRRAEAAQLMWRDVDLQGKTLTVHHTKNHESHTLPLSDYLYELLSRRKATATSEYVFPGTGRDGHIIDPRWHMEKVTRETGIKFMAHDVRRTFVTVAESLDISAYAVKRLVNHKLNGDVTAGYIVTDAERLRAPMQRVTDYILKCAGIRESAEVVNIHGRR